MRLLLILLGLPVAAVACAVIWMSVGDDARALYATAWWMPAVMLVLPAIFLTQAWRERRRR